ncbi:GNAT family N-acetyltransferase [Clostridiaceae bacterium HSG29]|nr:GNAT family N-acetyltransferase [Clostridiaceae bacterium HSG29]
MSKLIVKNATLNDLNDIASIELLCFPVLEAATKNSLKERISVYSKGFFIGEIDNKIIGFINGASTDDSVIKDAFFENMNLHENDGKNLVVFGLDVHPKYQRNGYARELMNYFIDFAKQEKKENVILTCKNHLIHYYESFGYVNFGVSESEHGGAKWYDMILKLKNN